eukprot:COSAG01_NODE_20521_length_949_cov_1.790588_1_plen_144_part_01
MTSETMLGQALGVGQEACQAACAAAPACVGYNYWEQDGYCRVYGPGLDDGADVSPTGPSGATPQGTCRNPPCLWWANAHTTTTIGGVNGPETCSGDCVGMVCVAVAVRNCDPHCGMEEVLHDLFLQSEGKCSSNGRSCRPCVT